MFDAGKLSPKIGGSGRLCRVSFHGTGGPFTVLDKLLGSIMTKRVLDVLT
jgi:hypothetical protein